MNAVELAARLVVPVCASVVLTAVALNFALAREAGAVRRRQRSPVATGSMMGFFAVFYLLVHRHVAEVAIAQPGLREALSAAGAALVAAGCAVNILGRIRLGRNWANQATVYEGQTLVSAGVFGLVRHPLYASLIWMFVGAALVYRNAAGLLAALLVFAPAMRYRAGQEERLLSDRFPDYAAYQRRVGRLFPRVGRRDG